MRTLNTVKSRSRHSESTQPADGACCSYTKAYKGLTHPLANDCCTARTPSVPKKARATSASTLLCATFDVFLVVLLRAAFRALCRTKQYPQVKHSRHTSTCNPLHLHLKCLCTSADHGLSGLCTHLHGRLPHGDLVVRALWPDARRPASGLRQVRRWCTHAVRPAHTPRSRHSRRV